MSIFSNFTTASIVIIGKTAKPANVVFNTPVVRPIMGGIFLSWDAIPDVDFKEYIIQLAPTSTWDASGNTEIFRGLGTEFLYTASTINTGTTKFLIKAVDTTSNYSVTATLQTITITAANWSSQTVSSTLEEGTLTLTWPTPSNAQFNIAGYQVKYNAGNNSTSWAGAVTSGHGTTEEVYSSSNSLSFPVTWGSKVEGTTEKYRTFVIKAKDNLGNLSSNEISISILINTPTKVSASSQFITNEEGTSVSTRVWWDVPSVSSTQLPISYYKVFYKDYKTAAPTFASRGGAYLENLGTTEFTQEVTWGPSKTSTSGTITSTSGDSDGIRRYWIVPVDTAGNWGVASTSGVESNDYLPDIEDVTVARPNNITAFTKNDHSTKSSNGVLELSWTLPTITTAPITSIRIFWDSPTWSTVTNKLTSTLGEKSSKSGSATKYSTPITWGSNNGSNEPSRTIYFVVYDSIGNISILGNESIAIGIPDTPTTLTGQVIDNNVILRWADPDATSLPVASYDVYRCPTTGTCTVSNYRDTATYITNVGGTNTYSFFETAAGTYKYYVTTYDSAGNYSTPADITEAVKAPRDFELLNEVSSKYNTSALTAGYCSGGAGANKADCESGPDVGDWIHASEASWTNILDQSGTTSILPVDTSETWAEHFIGTGSVGSPQYSTPQALITAGFIYFVKPETTATYWQKWDIGSQLTTATVELISTSQDYNGTVTSSPTLYYINDESVYESESITSTTDWTAGVTGNTSLLATTFRFVKVKVVYTSVSESFRTISQQKLSLGLGTVRDQSLAEVTISTLSGSVTNGIRVNFNKTFQDVNSIQVTPKYKSSGNQNTAIYDFTDSANPTYFDVYLLDTTDGSFALGDFTWQATGV